MAMTIPTIPKRVPLIRVTINISNGLDFIELEKEEYTFEETKKFLDHLEILKISNKIK